MDWIAAFYIALCLLAATLACGIGVFCWRRRSEPGARAYALMTWSGGAWALGLLLEMYAPTLEGKLFWDSVQFIATPLWFVFLIVFAFQFSGERERRAWWIGLLVGAPMIAGCSLSFVHGGEPFIRVHPHLVPGGANGALLYGFSTFSVGLVIFAYVLWLAGIGRLLFMLRDSAPLHRRQVALIVAGTTIPTLGGLVGVSVLIDSPYRDLTPLTQTLGHVFALWGLFGVRLFEIVPLARNVVLENLADAVVVLDLDGRVVDLNPAARAVLGEAGEGFLGRPATEVFAPWRDLVDRFRDVQQTTTRIQVANLPGGPRDIEVRIQPVRDQRGQVRGRVTISRDVTDLANAERELRRHRDHLEELVWNRTAELERQVSERRRLEGQLQQAQKMEAMGRLAGGIAHDLNNLLVPILGHAELGLARLSTEDPLAADLQPIREAALLAADLTKQILAFSRRQVLEIRVVDLNTVVNEFSRMLQRLLGERIELCLRLGQGLSGVSADLSQLQQVLMNLAINARDAMPDGGRLVIETAETSIEGGRVTPDPDSPRPGRYVLLQVSDTGMGMDSETQDRIFEPFFTTKDRGKGTGLGLATVFGIVRQHQGGISVSSDPGVGTTFRLYLPCAVDRAQEVAPVEIQPAASHAGATVVLVEDNDGVRRFVNEMLTLNGFTVLPAANAEEGERLMLAHSGPIDLLLTDVVLSGVSGRELVERVSPRRPEMRALFMSGYTDDVAFQRGALSGGPALLQKPFTVQTLLAKVRETLGNRNGPSAAASPAVQGAPARPPHPIG